MNNTSIMAFVLSGITCGITLSCSNPDNQYLEKIKQQVKEDALGVNLNYKNIDFQWIDTLSSKGPDPLWTKVSDELSELKIINYQIDSLSKLDPSKVVYYKAANTYKINNPLLNGVEQEIKKYFLFDENLNIVGKEEY